MSGMRQELLWEPETTPYVRPTIDEIRARPYSSLTAVGTFSGCGGSSLGLRMAGFRTVYAVEFIPAAADTYEANFPQTYVDRRDIRDVQASEVLDRLDIEVGDLDLLEGSPPCASFSAAGNREKAWGQVKKYSDSSQRTDDLFWEWARLLDGLRPRAFVAENVPGLEMGGAVGEYAHKITALLGGYGYRVAARVLNAANFGTPQERRRLILVGLRQDQEAVWEWPRPTTSEPYTTRQALGSVDPQDPDHRPFVEASSMDGYAVGHSWDALIHRRSTSRSYGDTDVAPLPEDFCRRCGGLLEAHEVIKRDGRHRVEVASCEDGGRAQITKDYFMLQVPDLDRPCPTLTATGASAGAASVTHPTERRKLTPAEAKAVCGFPADFVLTGTREQRSERMGRAVCPPLYEALGRSLTKALA